MTREYKSQDRIKEEIQFLEKSIKNSYKRIEQIQKSCLHKRLVNKTDSSCYNLYTSKCYYCGKFIDAVAYPKGGE